MSWQNPPNLAELAIGAIRDLVAAYRQSGLKTFAALDDIGPALGMTARHARRLFERDRNPQVSHSQLCSILLRGAALLHKIADELRQRAEFYDAQADRMAAQHRQLTLWDTSCPKQEAISMRQRAAELRQKTLSMRERADATHAHCLVQRERAA